MADTDNGLVEVRRTLQKEYLLDGGALIFVGLDLSGLSLVPIYWPGLAEGMFLKSTIQFIIGQAVLAIPLYFLARWWGQHIAYPRLGFAQFVRPKYSWWGERGRRGPEITQLVIGLVICTLVYSIIGTEAYFRSGRPWPKSAAHTMIEVPFVLFWVGVGFQVLSRKVFWWLSGLILLFFPLTGCLHLDENWVAVLTGVMMIVIGLVHLRRFLRDYPKMEGEGDAAL